MGMAAAYLDFATLKGRSIQRLCVLALDENGQVEFRKGDIELLLDDSAEVAVTFDYDRGLVLSSGRAMLPACETLSDWFDLQKSDGVIVRAELPESDLQRALYGTPIDELSVENDPNFPDTPIRLRFVAGQVVVVIGVEDTICTITFEPLRP
jgi:hypothetical protein